MTEKEKEQLQIEQIKRQVKEMLEDFTEDCVKKAVKAIKSSAVPPDYKEKVLDDNYRLAKAVIDSEMRNRPYKALAPDSKKEFENIHICL